MADEVVAAKGGMTKKAAVRLAMNKIGKDKGPTELSKYIKDELKIDLKPNHVSTYKGEILREGKKPAAAKKPAAKPAAQPAAPKPAPSSGGGIGLQDIHEVKALVGRVGANNLKSLIDLLAR